MRKLSNLSGSTSDSKTFGYNRDFTENIDGKKLYQRLIKQADSVPITKLFKYYGFNLNDQNRKIICPFSSHKGGRENSPSFYFYPVTNSFWCFGCKVGTRCCDFVSNMDNISKLTAAKKIIKLFNSDVDEDAVFIDRENFSEKLEIMLDFSNNVRNFRQSNSDVKSLLFIENICMIYDNLNYKHKLSNEALRLVVNQLKEKINYYELSIV